MIPHSKKVPRRFTGLLGFRLLILVSEKEAKVCVVELSYHQY
jgi:hypothetical protein